MRDLQTVFRLELLLLRRGRGLPIAAVLAALAGVWEATAVRERPWGIWGTLDFGTVLVSLILILSTGDQVNRDRTRRLDGVVFSTPVSTSAYIWGKYLAALVVLIGLALANLAGALLMDAFDPWRDPPPILQMGHAQFPPLGPWPYLSIWLLLMITPVVFGAAWMLAGATWRRGGRIAASVGALLLWILPAFGIGWPHLFDVSEGGASLLFDGTPLFNLANATMRNISHAPWVAWSPSAAARIVDAVRTEMPPPVPSTFVWNRVLFLGAAVLLVVLMSRYVGRQRPGRV